MVLIETYNLFIGIASLQEPASQLTALFSAFSAGSSPPLGTQPGTWTTNDVNTSKASLAVPATAAPPAI